MQGQSIKLSELIQLILTVTVPKYLTANTSRELPCDLF